MVVEVTVTKAVKKALLKLPIHILDKFRQWIDSVEQSGLEKTRESPGWHDEPLKGVRRGQRSIRLSRSYRAIYVVADKVSVIVLEVNKHDYS